MTAAAPTTPARPSGPQVARDGKNWMAQVSFTNGTTSDHGSFPRQWQAANAAREATDAAWKAFDAARKAGS